MLKQAARLVYNTEKLLWIAHRRMNYVETYACKFSVYNVIVPESVAHRPTKRFALKRRLCKHSSVRVNLPMETAPAQQRFCAPAQQLSMIHNANMCMLARRALTKGIVLNARTAFSLPLS